MLIYGFNERRIQAREGSEVGMSMKILGTIGVGLLIVGIFYFVTTRQINNQRGQGWSGDWGIDWRPQMQDAGTDIDRKRRGATDREYTEGRSCEEEWDRRHQEWERRYGERQRNARRPRYEE
jgi:hypothetical protein